MADVYRTVAAVLEAHAEVLRWAQTRAQIAIELWARGVELAAASGESTLLLRPQPTGPFARSPVFPETDPGAPWRRQAEAVLAAARAEVNASGRAAARILDEFSAGMPDGQFHMDQFLGGIGDWITGIATLVWKFNAIRALVDRDAMLDDAEEIRQGLWDTGAAITADPTQAVPLLFNTRLMHDNPGRWWGQLFPDIALTAAGGTAALSKSGTLVHGAEALDDLSDASRLVDDLPEGPYPPGAPWADPAVREQWVDELSETHPQRPVPTSEPWGRYQARETGPVETLMSGSGQQAWVDGVVVDADKVAAAEVKFVSTPGSSPYTGTMPPFLQEQALAKLDDQLLRYRAIVDDPGNPIDRLRLITNDPQAAEYLLARARQLFGAGADIVVEVRP